MTKPQNATRPAPAVATTPATARATTPATARATALNMLDAVLGEGRLMSELAGLLTPLEPSERARAQRLALDTLRSLERADRLLEPYLRKGPPLRVRNILRLGVTEMGQGGAAHGIVNECVGLVGTNPKTKPMRGLVNAVLRKMADEAPAAWDRMRVPRVPAWLRDPLTEAWGPDAMKAMEAVQFAGAPLDLTPRGDAAALAALVGGTLLPTGSVRLANAQVTALPGYAEGAWWVQDAAAALPARLLNVQPGERVLDMCAAPGGKTLQMAAAGGRVTALDISEKRMVRVSANLTRTGLSAEIVVDDALEHQGTYDAILLDAPCSATGTMRRHPDLPHAKDGAEFAALFALQEALLDHALTLLTPGGRLVFCTCSLLPDEGEVQVEQALARHAGLKVVPPQATWVEDQWRSSEGGLRLRPDLWADRGGMDGFYMAVLRRDG